MSRIRRRHTRANSLGRVNDYEVVESRRAYEGELSRIRVDRVRMPDGEVVTREVVEHPDAVALVPVDADGNVVLVRQYRHPLAEHLLEIPAGKCDVDDEEPSATARRELIEEVGLYAADLTELVHFRNSSGWTDEATTVYLATGLSPADPPDGYTAAAEEASIEILRVPLSEVVGRAQRGELADAKTVIGVLLAAARLVAPPS